MEINEFISLKSAINEIASDPIYNEIEIAKIMDSLHGAEICDRGDKIAEEAQELRDALNYLYYSEGRSNELEMAKDVLWELSDLSANYYQMLWQVGKATGLGFVNLQGKLLGMAAMKQQKRQENKDWQP